MPIKMFITFQKLFREYGYSLTACPKLQENDVADLLFIFEFHVFGAVCHHKVFTF